MTLEEKIEAVKKLEKTKKVWRKNYGSAEFKLASSLNMDLYGMPLNQSPNCQCIEDLFYLIKSMTVKTINQKQQQMTGQFKLKVGIVLALHGLNEMVTESNLTDEKALKILKKYPGHIVSFSAYPADWKALVKKDKGETTDTTGSEGAGDASGSAGEEDQRAILNKKKKSELIKLCQEASYPEAEWEELTAKELVNYIIGKVKA